MFFISYRRAESSELAALLTEEIRQIFGDRVFRDVDSLLPGEALQKLEARVRASEALIALVGPGWLDEVHRRAAEGIEDWVRIETVLALRHGVRIVPVLVKGALLPPPDELPEDLRPLADINWFTLDPERPRASAEELVQALVRLGYAPENIETIATFAETVDDARTWREVLDAGARRGNAAPTIRHEVHRLDELDAKLLESASRVLLVPGAADGRAVRAALDGPLRDRPGLVRTLDRFADRPPPTYAPSVLPLAAPVRRLVAWAREQSPLLRFTASRRTWLSVLGGAAVGAAGASAGISALRRRPLAEEALAFLEQEVPKLHAVLRSAKDVVEAKDYLDAARPVRSVLAAARADIQQVLDPYNRDVEVIRSHRGELTRDAERALRDEPVIRDAFASALTELVVGLTEVDSLLPLPPEGSSAEELAAYHGRAVRAFRAQVDSIRAHRQILATRALPALDRAVLWRLGFSHESLGLAG